MSACYDIAVFGSGFAGSLMATVAKRLGLSVVLIEKTQHPRVVIGESSTPLSNLLLEELAKRYDLPWLLPFTKWGTWQRSHPEIACGLKRGFTFFHHEPGREADRDTCAWDRQLLVAASPNDTIADTHWFRADIDEFLVKQAINADVDYIDHCNVYCAVRVGEAWQLSCEVKTLPRQVRARFLIDATGPQGLLHQLFSLQHVGLPGFPATSALYSHFKGVAPFAGVQQYKDDTPPYPPDAAAMHHVFSGGWIWVLHFNNGWTSAGVAATQPVARQFGFEEKEASWTRLLNTLPEVREQFVSSKAVRPFTYIPQLSSRSSEISGEGWAMLPSTAGFVDPMLSTGFPLALLGVLRLAATLEHDWKTPKLSASLAAYAQHTDAELLVTADLVSAMYANMADFKTFRALSLLYFAAASYAETARRLHRSELAPTFLLHTHPVFGAGLRRLTARARMPLTSAERHAVEAEILDLVAEFDVIGLSKRPEDHCYPVRASDLFTGAPKVHASQAEIADLLQRSGFPADFVNETAGPLESTR